MADATFTCPRCFFTAPLRGELKFCPHCGLPGAGEAAADTAPLEVAVGGRTFRVYDRVAVGSVCSVYRCRFADAGIEVEGVFKIARDPRANGLVANEADVLRHLRGADADGRHGAFLPAVVASFGFAGADPAAPPRQANVLRLHEAIASPADELYGLDEVKAQHPAGLDGRDVAWIWRRVLAVLGFAHAQGVVHGAVLPMHVLIEPREHKLVLIDWCTAVRDWRHNGSPPAIISGGHFPWYKSEAAARRPPAPPLDVAFGARCMIDLLGGDPVRAEFPPATTVDPALQRHFSRCLASAGDARPGAWKLLEDFDRLIDALWGPRHFRAFPALRKLGA